MEHSMADVIMAQVVPLSRRMALTQKGGGRMKRRSGTLSLWAGEVCPHPRQLSTAVGTAPAIQMVGGYLEPPAPDQQRVAVWAVGVFQPMPQDVAEIDRCIGQIFKKKIEG